MNSRLRVRADGSKMKYDTRSTMKPMLLSGAVLLFFTGAVTMAQTPQTNPAQNPAEPAQTQTQPPQGNQFSDLRQLNLTPDQIQRIRAINFELRDERQAANLRLRQSRRALSEAIESPTPNEPLISQRSREVAEAQANTIRLNSLAEARILQVLTPEQRIRVREMRARNQALQTDRQRQRRNGGGGQPALQGPLNPVLTPAQRRALRRQQKP
jgi:periplasmic protein CpxP/Spy